MPARAARRFLAQIWDSFFQMLEAPAGRLHVAAGSLLLFTLVLLVYQPILPGSFLMDDWRLTETDNPLVNGELTPFNIWFQTDFTLSSVALWLQRLVWGASPGGYHLVNLLLHAASAVLIWKLLAKLKIPGAWLAAALYAVHPVCVTSVARVAEIKNTLSLPLFLFSFLAYLRYETLALHPGAEKPEASPAARLRATGWYVLALLSFLAALLAKTSTVMLPLLLLVCAAWQRGRIARKDWVHAGPFLILSLAFGLMSIWFQKHQALSAAGQMLPPESFWQRLATAGHLLGFYLGKALWPLHLNLVYPRWQWEAAAASSRIACFAFVAILILGWRYRRGWGRHLLFGLGCFAIALFPVLGFFDSQFLTRWQVSDHLQYLPLVAPVALVAAGLAAALHKNAFRPVVVVLLLALSVSAFRRAAVFSTEEKLLRDCVAKNPAAEVAQNDLGVIYAARNNYPAAMDCFAAALRAGPGYAEVHCNLGHALLSVGRLPEAETQFEAALKLKPFDPATHENYANLLGREGRNREAVCHCLIALRFKPDIQTRLELASLFHQTGRPHQAIDQLHRVLRASPDDVGTLNNLAWLLATCGTESERNGDEAVRCAEKACALTGYKQAKLTGTLAAAYAEARRFPEAVATGQTTVKLADAAGDKGVVYVGNQLLTLYLNNQPYHEPPGAGGE
jgi:tetratricopeptide (TPR) repeat protein